MVRLLLVTFATGLLSACAHLPDWVRIIPLGGTQSASLSDSDISQYSFEWRLSGDRQVAPLQVFDNGKQTWLQFQPDQPLPAIFLRMPQGDQPLTYQRQGPYVVLPGVWPHLVLRGGRLQSQVERLQPEQVEVSAISVHDGSVTESQVGSVANTMLGSTESQEGELTEVLTDVLTEVLTEPSFTHAILAASPQASAVDLGPAEPFSSHAVSPQDKNLRSVLSRWAVAAGWTFTPEHWVVDVDIPIVGSATFDAGFKEAVQDLLATTELADRPLQPCFYSNQVLRIVPYAQTCDRSAGVGLS